MPGISQKTSKQRAMYCHLGYNCSELDSVKKGDAEPHYIEVPIIHLAQIITRKQGTAEKFHHENKTLLKYDYRGVQVEIIKTGSVHFSVCFFSVDDNPLYQSLKSKMQEINRAGYNILIAKHCLRAVAKLLSMLHPDVFKTQGAALYHLFPGNLESRIKKELVAALAAGGYKIYTEIKPAVKKAPKRGQQNKKVGSNGSESQKVKTKADKRRVAQTVPKRKPKKAKSIRNSKGKKGRDSFELRDMSNRAPFSDKTLRPNLPTNSASTWAGYNKHRTASPSCVQKYLTNSNRHAPFNPPPVMVCS